MILKPWATMDALRASRAGELPRYSVFSRHSSREVAPRALGRECCGIGADSLHRRSRPGFLTASASTPRSHYSRLLVVGVRHHEQRISALSWAEAPSATRTLGERMSFCPLHGITGLLQMSEHDEVTMVTVFHDHERLSRRKV